MKKLAGTLLAATAAAMASVTLAPTGNADICAGADGRHYAVGGCTNVVNDVADATVAGAAIRSAEYPTFPGELPCYTVEGVPYYTPPGDPC
ncbi:hypothetical protein [Mycolicibacterium sediminis]|uniref:Secreted protein n=1 Tax=Mycolicibacterium sediminis TaxID=1286180 RepID=A0A7I7QKY2_9MYCO|nr:hypothetical protein [Mycolicibacterium sediminis]BBY27008.1 hypothetical protein MSEDJ_11040 [Mycolicibacterium sediminis]